MKLSFIGATPSEGEEKGERPLLSDKNKSDSSRSKNNNDNHTSFNKKERQSMTDKQLARLLIVDDDPEIVQVLKLGLQKNRFLVTIFTNPEEALQSFKSNAKSYCVVVSDMRMPSLSGIQLAKKVKEINPSVKVVLMTGFEIRDDEFSKVFPSTSVDGFVQKPVGIKELANKILSIIGESKRRSNED